MVRPNNFELHSILQVNNLAVDGIKQAFILIQKLRQYLVYFLKYLRLCKMSNFATFRNENHKYKKFKKSNNLCKRTQHNFTISQKRFLNMPILGFVHARSGHV